MQYVVEVNANDIVDDVRRKAAEKMEIKNYNRLTFSYNGDDLNPADDISELPYFRPKVVLTVKVGKCTCVCLFSQLISVVLLSLLQQHHYQPLPRLRNHSVSRDCMPIRYVFCCDSTASNRDSGEVRTLFLIAASFPLFAEILLICPRPATAVAPPSEGVCSLLVYSAEIHN